MQNEPNNNFLSQDNTVPPQIEPILLDQQIHHPEQDLQYIKRDSENAEERTSTDAASIIQERHMLKRQILNQLLEPYKIDVDWIKEEYLDQIENEPFARFVAIAVKNNSLPLPTNERAVEMCVLNYVQSKKDGADSISNSIDGSNLYIQQVNNQNALDVKQRIFTQSENEGSGSEQRSFNMDDN